MSKARDIFVNADAWHDTSHLLYQQLKRDQMQFVGPAVASAAFSLELYFKTIYEMDGVTKRPKAHNLRVLFKNLSRERRRQIEKHYDANMGSMREFIKQRTGQDLSVENVLEKAQDMYELMRYFHEGLRPGSTWNADPILNAVRKVILEGNPDW